MEVTRQAGPSHMGILCMAMRGRPRQEGERYPSGKLKPKSVMEDEPVETLASMERDFVDSMCKVFGGGNYANVYVIAKNDAEVKIGVSRNVRRRVAELQVSNSSLLSIFWAIRLMKDDAQLLEKRIHQKLRTTLNHSRGEWYMMAPETAVGVIRGMAKKLQLETFTDLAFGFGRGV